ncbi:MAG: hypothetical protein JNM99_01940 [Verrucomicrobiaceae bacterium]|nr:hypothetical protein [Verrucomicrobiaceae bacterium]
MNEPSKSLPDEVELVRFREGEGVRDCCEVLDQAGVPYRLSTDVPAFDVSMVGGGAAKGSVIIMVAAADEVKARTALLEDARKALSSTEVPDDYHLREFADTELQLIVRQPREWSGYDVAAAECLLRERGIAFDPPCFELTEADIEQRKEEAREFKAAHLLLVVLLVAIVVRLAWMTIMDPAKPQVPLPVPSPTAR